MKYLYHHRTQGKNVEGVHVRSVCHALEKEGHQIRLVSVTSTNEDYHVVKVDKESPGGKQKPSLLKLIAKKLPEPFFELLELGYNFYAFFRLWVVVHTDRPERIYERYSLFLFTTLLLGKLYKIPVVYEINDSAILDRLRPLFFKRLAKFIEKRVFANAHGLVYVSNKLKEMIEAAYGPLAQSVISPNAIDSNLFYYDDALHEQAKAQYDLTEYVVCGFMGSFARWHGMHHFMEEFAPLLKQHPKLALLLLGDGDTLPRVREITREHGLDKQVMIIGNVPHDQIINYIRAMDFSVLPNSNEYGSPLKLFELMGTGVPLVAPSFAPVTDIIEDGVDGWIFEKGKFSHCISRVLEVYTDEEGLREKARLAAQKIKQNHQWLHNVQQLDGLFNASTSKQ